jgi:hypothetical protein
MALDSRLRETCTSHADLPGINGHRIRYSQVLSAADREIRLGIWKIHILHHADTREVWRTWLLERLAETSQHLRACGAG